MRSRTNIIIGIILSICAVVAALVLFAPTFSVLSDYGAERGNAFEIMFSTGICESYERPVALFIVAFIFECLAFLGGIVSAALSGKTQGLALGISSLLAIAGGVIFLCAIPVYQAAYGDLLSKEFTSDYALGYGPILNAVFSFVGGLLGVYGAYTSLKAA